MSEDNRQEELMKGLLHMVGYCMKIGEYLYDAVVEGDMTVDTATEIALMCDEEWSGTYSDNLRNLLNKGGYL
jgi:hypothetical protein